MEFGKGRPRGKRVRRGAVPEEYSTRLRFYRIPPMHNVSLEEFEELALSRLKLLQEVEKQRGIHGTEKKSNSISKLMPLSVKSCSSSLPAFVLGMHVDESLFSRLSISPRELHTPRSSHLKREPQRFQATSYWVLEDQGTGSVGDDDDGVLAREERRRDHISHYILRLAYCRNEEMRRWFLTQETELLKHRFLNSLLKDKDDFFQLYRDELCFQLVLIPISSNLSDEKNRQLSMELQDFYPQKKSFNPDGTVDEVRFHGYKIPFSAALDLVRTRQVVLKQGFVYIPESNEDFVVSMVCSKFRARLSEELVKTLHHMSVVDDDERISPMLKKLKYRYLGEDFSTTTQVEGGFQLSQINAIAKESFPPCMRHLHETLRKEHHLKHFARLQYGLFLKSIGLTLEQALALWRAEFVKKMDPDKFEKQYAYNVRHSYGKEGKRANYTAYSCVKIIMGNSPGQGDSHGCPFKHWDEDHIQKMLASHGIPHKGVRQVTAYLQDHHYQLACQKYFEITHGVSSAPFSLEHPNQFYLESRKIRGGQEGVAKQEGVEKQEGGCHDDTTGNDTTGNEFGDLSEKDLECMDTT